MKLNYYARLNDKNICVEIISTKKNIEVKEYIKIPDYNETLLYRSYDGEQWSSETYEPSFEKELQDKVNQLENEILAKDEEIKNLKAENISTLEAMLDLDKRIQELEGGSK